MLHHSPLRKQRNAKGLHASNVLESALNSRSASAASHAADLDRRRPQSSVLFLSASQQKQALLIFLLLILVLCRPIARQNLRIKPPILNNLPNLLSRNLARIMRHDSALHDQADGNGSHAVQALQSGFDGGSAGAAGHALDFERRRGHMCGRHVGGPLCYGVMCCVVVVL